MYEIGRIRQVQVQRSSLKVERHRSEYYDPRPLLVVSSLLLTPHGVVGITAEGEHVIDVHNVDHPDSRNRGGGNGISIGFTSHYQTMREHFGPHLTDGIAGENILVEIEGEQRLADLERGLVIKRRDREQLIHLTRVKAATPCIEFSHFAINTRIPPSNRRIKETLQFLDKGRRGFYTTLPEQQEIAVVQAGDTLFAL